MGKIDCSKYGHKEFLKPEIRLIELLEENGFDGKLLVNNINKIEFEVTKDGVSDIFSVTSRRKEYISDAEEYFKQFLKSFELKCENQRLRKLLNGGLNK